MGSSKNPKPAEIAADVKKRLIPIVKKEWRHRWYLDSKIYNEPLLEFEYSGILADLSLPEISVYEGDPVDTTIQIRYNGNLRENWRHAGFICPANEKKVGGEWETAVDGVEERLCRRSSLSANLGYNEINYPIAIGGGIFSTDVVVFRKANSSDIIWPPTTWPSLPVCSMPPQRWPKLTQNGTKYSFSNERDIMLNKIRGAVRICAYNNLNHIVIGDWGLGKGYRNPPQELAELWRDVILFDPLMRSSVRKVSFIFEDVTQSTTALIEEELEKQKRKHHSKGGASSSSKTKSKSKKSKSPGPTSSSSSGGNGAHALYEDYGPLTDFEIFQAVFDPQEIQRYIQQRDARYGLDMLTI